MSRRELPAKWIRDMLPKRCQNCGSTTGIVYHHIVPVELGGNEVPSNISVLCSICHGRVHYGKNGVLDHGALVRSGMKRAKERGVKLGKPGADHEKAMRAIAEHSTMFNGGDWTESEIKAAVGVSTTCYYKIKKELIHDMDSGEWRHSFEKPRIVRRTPLYDHLIQRLRREHESVSDYRMEEWV